MLANFMRTLVVGVVVFQGVPGTRDVVLYFVAHFCRKTKNLRAFETTPWYTARLPTKICESHTKCTGASVLPYKTMANYRSVLGTSFQLSSKNEV